MSTTFELLLVRITICARACGWYMLSALMTFEQFDRRLSQAKRCFVVCPADKYNCCAWRYSSHTESPRRTLPVRNTEAYTPTLARLCWAADRRMPTSLGRSL